MNRIDVLLGCMRRRHHCSYVHHWQSELLGDDIIDTCIGRACIDQCLTSYQRRHSYSLLVPLIHKGLSRANRYLNGRAFLVQCIFGRHGNGLSVERFILAGNL